MIDNRQKRLVAKLRKRLLLDTVETTGFFTDEELLDHTEGNFVRVFAEVALLLEDCKAALCRIWFVRFWRSK